MTLINLYYYHVYLPPVHPGHLYIDLNPKQHSYLTILYSEQEIKKKKKLNSGHSRRVTAIVTVQSVVTQRVLPASSMLAIIYWPATLSVRCRPAVPWRNLFDSANIRPGNRIRQKFSKTFRWTTAINVPTYNFTVKSW